MTEGPALIWLSLACLLAAAGVGLWGLSLHRQRVRGMDSFVERTMAARPLNEPTAPVAVLEDETQDGAQKWLWEPPWLANPKAKKQVLLWIGIGALLALLLGVLIHPLAGAVICVLSILLGLFFAWWRWQKLRNQVVAQLPSFIDGMVRMVVLGHAPQSAFLMASSTAKMPVAEVMQRAAGFAKAGMSLSQAILAASRDLHLDEIRLLAAILDVGTRYGGRVDALLERVSHFMRDREQAEQELRALSAEVRISAWVLSLLPLVVGGMIIVANAAYFMKMWADPTGRMLVMVAAGLQLTGVICLYRLAKMDK